MIGFVTSKAKGFKKLSWLFRIQRKAFKLGIFKKKKKEAIILAILIVQLRKQYYNQKNYHCICRGSLMTGLLNFVLIMFMLLRVEVQEPYLHLPCYLFCSSCCAIALVLSVFSILSCPEILFLSVAYCWCTLDSFRKAFYCSVFKNIFIYFYVL